MTILSSGTLVDFIPPPPPDPPAEGELVYPLLYTSRGASRSTFVDSPEAAIDRLAIGMMDAHHSIGFDSGNAADTDPPAAGYIKRTDAYLEILAGDLGSDHYIFTYHNVTEAKDVTTDSRAAKIKDYLDTSVSKNGGRDGWGYDGAGNKVILFANQFFTNISDEVELRFYPDTGTMINYCEWYAREMVQKHYFDVMFAAGLGIGKGGCGIFLDNYQHHANKQGVDWDNNGVNNNAQNFWDTEAPSHNYDDKAVTSITRVGTLCTLITAAPHPLETGHQEHIRVIGADQSEYNGDHDDSGFADATVINNTTITFNVNGSPATPATGVITFTALDNNGEPRSIASNHFAQVRTNMRLTIETIEELNPGVITHVNGNQWMDRTDPGLRNIFETDPTALRNCILEFRDNGDPEQASTHAGFSENNVKNPNPDFPGPGESQNFPRCGVGYNGLNAGQSGSFLASFCNMYQQSRLAHFPGILAGSMGCECLGPAFSTGYPANVRTYPNIPVSNTNWHMARWGMVLAWLAGAYSSCHGIRPNTEKSGAGNSTVLWDESGLINGAISYNGFPDGGTKLYHKWMGPALEPPPLAPAADGTYQRRFQNCIIIANPDNDENDSPRLVDVSALVGGPYTRFDGDQDPVFNDGTDLVSDFFMNPIDAGVYPVKAWHDAL